jgi:hypothetical protein
MWDAQLFTNAYLEVLKPAFKSFVKYSRVQVTWEAKAGISLQHKSTRATWAT